MGFTVMVEVGDWNGFVASRLPTNEGGKAVFAFLSALSWYCIVPEDDQDTSLQSSRDWFKMFQTYVDQPLCEEFKPIIDCMWGDGGGIGGEFNEDEYEWYLKRNSGSSHSMTETEFREFTKAGKERWSSIDKVIENVKRLIHIFKNNLLREEDGLYVAEHMIPDFESLYDTLLIFKNFWYDTVRLNFS